MEELSRALQRAGRMNASWADLVPAPQWDAADLLFTYTLPTSIALIVLYAAIFLVGFAGNVVVLALLMKRRRMDKVANAFMLNLAVCDLLVICLCVPINLGMEVYQSYVYGPVLCKSLPYVQAVVVSTSVLTLTVVSLDRYMAICYPLRAKVLSTKSRVRRAVLATWLFSAVIMLPIAIFSEIEVKNIIYPVQVDVVLCSEKWPSAAGQKGYDLTLFAVLLALPLGTMCVTYGKIAHKLWRRDTVFQKKPGSHCRMNSKNDVMLGRRRVVTVFMALTAFFALSWLPYFSLMIWLDFQEDPMSKVDAGGVFPFLQCLGIANSAIDPVCYCISDRTVRKFIRSLRECHNAAKESAGARAGRQLRPGSCRNGRPGKVGQESVKSCRASLGENGRVVTMSVSNNSPKKGQEV
ncbi:PREDICTED: gastrin/cholecystokinin type B receptor-like [Branchiostoma belcheri]|uniref:Gastrin/cholecystokinin type B receptor-like n=1 Tax=Branchiostoma belcheri TaxID=7741 RepID=A0A6P4XW26_BRABE|nr:PREDICTED: gastrin/cholecystokinin type B receptor-like [Branchiostoma belcheri]